MAEKTTIAFEPTDIKQLSDFFKTNKKRYHEMRIILTKKKYAGQQPVSFNEALIEAKKHDLIDSRTKSLNERQYYIRFTKKRTH
jgi:hypothetical protein